MLQRSPLYTKWGKPHLIVSSTSGQPLWTSRRKWLRIGFAKSADFVMYKSTLSSLFPMLQQMEVVQQVLMKKNNGSFNSISVNIRGCFYFAVFVEGVDVSSIVSVDPSPMSLNIFRWIVFFSLNHTSF